MKDFLNPLLAVIGLAVLINLLTGVVSRAFTNKDTPPKESPTYFYNEADQLICYTYYQSISCQYTDRFSKPVPIDTATPLTGNGI